MYKKYILSFALLGTLHHAPAKAVSFSDFKKVCIIAGAVGATALTYKAFGHWLVKRAQAHFINERAVLNNYAIYSAQTQSWTTHDIAFLQRDLKLVIVHQHNTNRNRWNLGVMYDICYGQPAMYVSDSYRNFPLLQHVEDIDWYSKHLKAIRFLGLHPDEQELVTLIYQLDYIKQLILSDYDYTQEGALYHAGNH